MNDPVGDTGAQPPPPRPVWIVRALGPRPAPTFAAKLFEVARRTLWFLALSIALNIAFFAAGVNTGNAGSQEIIERFQRNALLTFAWAVFLGPLIEETVFRVIPSMLSDLIAGKSRAGRWALGVPMTLAFALVHNVRPAEHGAGLALIKGWVLDTSIWPVGQFVLGLLLWDLMRRYGWWACIFAHVLHNGIPMSLALLARPG